MIPIKIQCGCGQRYAFEVEPVNNLMPSPVACPVCGADGTAAANESIAFTAAAENAAAPVSRAPLRAAAPAPPAAASARPPVGASRNPVANTPVPNRAVAPNIRGNDGWSRDETAINKLGTYVTLTPSILGAMLAGGIFGVQVPLATLCIVIGVCGLVGGALNVLGRGPWLAGAFVGFLMGLGGFGAVYWWIQGRERIFKFEVLIAFVVGAAPGFGLQYLLQRWVQKRAAAG